MCISVDPGTYAITAGEWGGVQTQTHVVKLASGQSANLDFVFSSCGRYVRLFICFSLIFFIIYLFYADLTDLVWG